MKPGAICQQNGNPDALTDERRRASQNLRAI
jgi:hypothetical protein